jgi:hypothetical protein
MRESPAPILFCVIPTASKGRLGENIHGQSTRANQPNPLHLTFNLLANLLFFNSPEPHTRHRMYAPIRAIVIMLFAASTVAPALSASLRYGVQLVLTISK